MVEKLNLIELRIAFYWEMLATPLKKKLKKDRTHIFKGMRLDQYQNIHIKVRLRMLCLLRLGFKIYFQLVMRTKSLKQMTDIQEENLLSYTMVPILNCMRIELNHLRQHI